MNAATATTEPARTSVSRPTVRPSRWATARAIALVEGRRVLRHPATIVGALGSTAAAVLFHLGNVPLLDRDVPSLSAAAAPLAAGTFVALHLAASRIRRDGTQEIVGTVPVAAPTRTVGLALAALWPAALALIWAILGVGVMAVSGGLARPDLADLLATPAFVLFAGTFGVAAGRWAPSPVVPLATVPVLTVVLGELSARADVAVRLMPWADWFTSRGLIEMWPREPWLHLGYVVALAVSFAALAVLRHRRSVLVGAFVVVAALGTVLAARPLLTVWEDPAEVEALLSAYADPHEWLLDCEAVDAVEVCAPSALLPLAPRWADPALRARELLPAAARPAGLSIDVVDPWNAQLMLSLDEQLTRQEFASAIDLADDGETVLLASYERLAASGMFTTALETVRIGMGFGGVDDAPDPDGGPVPCSVHGEARELVAYTLALHAHPDAPEALDALLAEQPYAWQGQGENRWWNDELYLGLPWSETNATNWSRAGAVNALRLAETLDDPTVLHDEWDRWMEPSTSADELLVTFGLDPLPTSDELAARQGIEPPTPTDDAWTPPSC